MSVFDIRSLNFWWLSLLQRNPPPKKEPSVLFSVQLQETTFSAASWKGVPPAATTWNISSIKPRVPWFYRYTVGRSFRMWKIQPQTVCFLVLFKGLFWRYNGKGGFFFEGFEVIRRISEASTFLASHLKQKLHPTMSNKQVHFIKTYELNAEYRTMYNYTLCFVNESMDQMTLHASLLLFFASTYWISTCYSRHTFEILGI